MLSIKNDRRPQLDNTVRTPESRLFADIDQRFQGRAWSLGRARCVPVLGGVGSPRRRVCHDRGPARPCGLGASRSAQTGGVRPPPPPPRGRVDANTVKLLSKNPGALQPLSHPFVKRLIGTMRRECLDHVLCWNAGDLERTLADFQAYYNAARSHASLEGYTPLGFAGERTAARAEFNHVRWISHCRGHGPASSGGLMTNSRPTDNPLPL